MALSLRKSSDRGTVGLDIDGRYLAAAQVADGRVDARRQPRAARAAWSATARSPTRRRSASELKSFAAETGLPKNVRLGVANQQIVVRVVELPRIEDEKQRDAAVRFQAAEAIAMPLDEAVLDHQVVGDARGADGSAAHAGRGRRRPPHDDRDAASRPCSAAGLKPEGIDLDAFALVRTLARRRARRRGRRPRLLPPRRRDQPRHRGRLHLLLHPPAVRRLGRRGRRLALADEIRLSIDYYMAQPRRARSARSCSPGPARPTTSWSRASACSSACRSRSPRRSVDRRLGARPAGEDPHRYTVAAGLALGAAA